MRKPVCYIFGAVTDGTPLEPPLPLDDDYVIAADGGLTLCRALKLTPDLIVGDFDSLNAPVPNGENVIHLPCEKDETDTFYAVRTGFERGYREFRLYGCVGGKRFDHTLANIQTLLWLSLRWARGYLYAGTEILTVITNSSLEIAAGLRGYFSVFACSGNAQGVNITGGVKYQLTDAQLSDDFPLGVSNELTGKPACISVNRGSLLIVFPNGSGA